MSGLSCHSDIVLAGATTRLFELQLPTTNCLMFSISISAMIVARIFGMLHLFRTLRDTPNHFVNVR